MSSSSRHPKRPIRSPDPRDLPSVGPSSASRHGNRDFEMRRHPPNSFWDTVINHSDDDHHRSRPISKQPRECPDCRRSFSSSRWEEHRATCPAINEKPYECKECGTSFKKNSNLEKHKRLVHRGEKNFACNEPGCGRLFGQKSNLNSHVKAVHLGEKPFVCEESGCARRFSQKSGLKAHIKTVHHGERPYVCDCGSSFGHRGDVSFCMTACITFACCLSCSLYTFFELFLTCIYRSLTSWFFFFGCSFWLNFAQLNRHIRVLHEKQRPFTCHLCPEPKAFGRKSVLMRHMLTHQSGDGDVRMTEASSSSRR